MSRLARLEADLAVALGWLTRLPTAVPVAGERSLAMALWAFPLAGLVVAAAGGLTLVVAWGFGASPWLAAVAAVAAMIWLTGALHEDGFADLLDGLGARGDRAERLAAMRDSHLGVYGTIGLVVLLLARVLALGVMPPLHALMALASSAALGRTAIGVVMLSSEPARRDGAGFGAGQAEVEPVAMAMVAAALIGFLAAAVAGIGALDIVLAFIVAAALALWVNARAKAAFGGYTGDVLGGASALVETAVLVCWSLFVPL